MRRLYLPADRITLVCIVLFAMCYMGQSIKMSYVCGGSDVLGAVYFIFLA
jgi:uncharacterized protein (DUF486 family)